MSACKHAEPLGYDGWESEGKPTSKERLKEITVECACGWRGDIGEILHCGGEVDCTETMWCPECKTAGWIYS